MWQLETDRGKYAIKQLSPDADMHDSDTVGHYNASESIAETFSGHGVRAIFALNWYGEYLQVIENVGYLVYPWTNAVALGRHEIRETHVVQVARTLAKMHLAAIAGSELKDAKIDFLPEDKMVALVHRALECNVRDATLLNEQLPVFLRMVDAQKKQMRILNRRLVISHGDADHKNVLWDTAGDPILIDWESARRINPTYEIVVEALDWSGITSTFHPGLFEKMISSYSEAGGVVEHDTLRASFDCVLGDWLNWLMFNVGRSLDMEDAEEREIGAEQVDLSLSAILRLLRLLPNLLSVVDL